MEHYELRPGWPLTSTPRPYLYESSTNKPFDNAPTACSGLFNHATRQAPPLGGTERRKPLCNNDLLAFPNDFNEP